MSRHSSAPALKRFYDPQFKLHSIKLMPGEYHACGEEIVITTVLGSCVAACLWDEHRKVGGMNHFMLPESGSSGFDLNGESGRYGVYAMELLINDLIKLGALKQRLKAKIFGGGQVIESLASSNVGERNAEFITRFLATERIPIMASDLLDVWPRRVCLFPNTGRVLVRKIRDRKDATLASSEQAYRKQMEQTRPAASGGGIELF
jgi:chemotaxis protein CheD